MPRAAASDENLSNLPDKMPVPWHEEHAMPFLRVDA
jgi:hypothetical protein